MAAPAQPQAAPPAQGGAAAPRLATLYVGDLGAEVTEPALFEFFSKYGQVVSVRVCRDMHSQASLGYGYVNYQNSEDAARVLETLNYTPLRPGGRPMRIMWYQRDPTLRRSGQGNVFVKDLNKDIDDKSLSEIFSVFGSILSAKVSRDKEGKSNGYGFVHFEREEDGQEAIAKMNGMQLNGVKVFVGTFKRRRDRFQELETTFSNVFFRNVLAELSEEQFTAAISRWGKVVSVCLRKSDKFKTQYAFANFETHEQATKCIAEANGAVIPDLSGSEPFFAARAMKRRERQLTRQIEQLSRISERQLANLYVKNLPDVVDDERLRDMFSPYGPILSCVVQKDTATTMSKGFGYVAFKTKEAADKAIAEMNGKLMDGKPLYVAFHQTAEQRRRQLEQRRANPNNFRWAGFSAPQQQQPIPPAMPSMYPYPNPWQQPAMLPQYYGAMRPPGMPMGMKQPMMFPQQRQFPVMPGAGGPQRMMRPPQQGGVRPGAVPQPGAPRPGVPPVAAPKVPVTRPAGVQGAQQQKNIPGMYGLPNLTSSALAAMSSEEQKNALGERLYARIYAVNPDQAAKITGMLLEMDTTEILNVLEDDVVLKSKIDEALTVLRAHQDK
jgi:polyadenylate-binding protein